MAGVLLYLDYTGKREPPGLAIGEAVASAPKLNKLDVTPASLAHLTGAQV
jgi:hypothetical protein